MRKEKLHAVFTDIRFWILLFLILRLYGITNPPLEVAHNWRQTTVTMVARNFLETDNNILLPRVDIAGDLTGITGMEFPLLNYLIYLVSLVFGYDHWYGRLINLLVSGAGILYFYKLVLKFFDKKVAFNAAMLLLCSLWFTYSRKIMPDTFSVSLVIIGLYYGAVYNGRNHRALLMAFLFTLAGVLSKLPAAYLLVLILPQLYFLSRNRQKHALYIALGALLLIVPVVWWYFYWVPYLVREYGFWHFFMGKPILQGMAEIKNNLGDTLSHFYNSALKFTGFAAFISGLTLAVLHRNRLLMSVWALLSVSFLGVVLKGGFTFAHHAYYVIPYVPVMALVAGYAISQIRRPALVTAALVVIMLENILNQHQDFRLKERERALVHLETDLDSVDPQRSLVVINSNEVPTPVYFAHRKGWVASNEQLSGKQFIDLLTAKGCRYAVVLKRYLGSEIELAYPVVFSNEDYIIYRLPG